MTKLSKRRSVTWQRSGLMLRKGRERFAGRLLPAVFVPGFQKNGNDNQFVFTIYIYIKYMIL